VASLPAIAATTVLAVTLVFSPLAGAAAPAWLAPSDLSEAGQDANFPQVALDPAGNAIVVWTRWNGTNWVVQTTARPVGSDWQPPVALSETGQDAYDPELARDGAGNAVAVWRRWDGSNWVVQAAARPTGGSWQSAVDLSQPGQDADYQDVGLDAAGNAVAVWRRSDGTNTIVQAAIRPAAESWQPAVDLSQAGADAHQPRVALDAAGNAIAIWRRNMPNSIVQAAVRPAGGSWSPAVNLSQPANDVSAFSPQVALDGMGNAVAVWRAYEPQSGLDSLVQAGARPAQGSWQPAVNLSQPGQSAFLPQVALDPAGNAVVVWTRSDGTNTIVQAAARTAGETWQPAVDLSQAAQEAGLQRVAVDLAGNAFAVWYRFNGSNNIVQAAVRPAGGIWSPAVNLSQPGQSALWPDVAVDPAGDALVVWERSDGSNEIVQGAAYDAAGPVMRGLAIPVSGTVGAPLQVAVDPFDVWSALAGQPTWSFGDGTIASGASVSHAYGAQGTYTVSVEQGDALGNTSTASRYVSISAPPPPPPPAAPPPSLPPPPTSPPPPTQVARCVVPNVKGKTLMQARKLLNAGRCALGRVSRKYSARVKLGRIISQSRRPSARFARGTKVNVVVSRGRRR
jgi:hypothetical protein